MFAWRALGNGAHGLCLFLGGGLGGRPALAISTRKSAGRWEILLQAMAWDREMPLGSHSGCTWSGIGVANCSMKDQMANIWEFEGLLCLLPILLCFLLAFQKIKTILGFGLEAVVC